jgi:hypothetical protein
MMAYETRWRVARWFWPLVIGPLTLASVAAQAEHVRRMAIVVGVNDGGPGRAQLRHAGRDAASIGDVLAQLGGVAPEDLLVLNSATPETVAAALARLRNKIDTVKQRGLRAEVFFYYSGHSDEMGLLLRGDRLRYADLRRMIGSLPAEVRVAVLDSCASGAMTRAKGGFRGPPFMVDASTDVRGHAYVASASSTEAAQESDRLRGSFFTHHLVAGLRGAADANRDRKVTLDEAYHYAFAATLKQTESTRSGPQHPSYDMRLSGSGGLVLTDLRGKNALLVFGADVRGRLYVRDSKDNLVAELRKHAKGTISLALGPGTYQVRLSEGGRVLAGTFSVSGEEPTVVARRALGEGPGLASSRRKGAWRGYAPRHLFSASYSGLLSQYWGGRYTDPSYRNAFPVRYFSDLMRESAHGAELRYLHRLGPLYLGLTTGLRFSSYRYEEIDALVRVETPNRVAEFGDSTDVYALLSTEWRLPVWNWSRWSVWRWVHPLVGLDIGAGYVRQKGTTKFVLVEELGNGEESLETSAPARVVDTQQGNWRRSLPAFHGRARVGLSLRLSHQLRLDLVGHAGLEVSRRLFEKLGDRSEPVDEASIAIPALGMTAGLTLGI